MDTNIVDSIKNNILMVIYFYFIGKAIIYLASKMDIKFVEFFQALISKIKKSY